MTYRDAYEGLAAAIPGGVSWCLTVETWRHATGDGCPRTSWKVSLLPAPDGSICQGVEHATAEGLVAAIVNTYLAPMAREIPALDNVGEVGP